MHALTISAHYGLEVYKTMTKKKIKKKKKKNALIACHDGKEFWTTQEQFWQWVRDRVVVKLGDYPLKGQFVRANEEYTVFIGNTLLNLKHPNHLHEALTSRRKAFSSR